MDTRSAHRALAAIFAALAAGCAEGTIDLDPSGPGGGGPGSLPTGGEELAGRASTPVDLVFILDSTVSMRVESERLVRDVEALVAALPPDVDLNVGVDLNDVHGDTRRETGRVTWSYAARFPFATDVPSIRRACIAYPHLQGCLTGAQWAGPSPDAVAALRRVLDVGNCSSGHFDATLDTLARVLDEAAPGGCNARFFRPGARRVFVLITDGADFSAAPIDDLVAALRGAGDARLAVLNGQRDGRATRCGAGPTCGTLCASPDAPGSQRACRAGDDAACDRGEACVEGRCLLGAWASCAWCDAFGAPDCCEAEAGARNVELAAVFALASGLAVDACAHPPAADGRCLLGSICDADLRPFFRQVGESLLGGARRFALARPLACPGFARAFVAGGRFGEGVELARGDDFEAARDGRSVLVRGPRLPLEGERLRVVDGCSP